MIIEESDVASLAALGHTVAQLLSSGAIESVADGFGYALAFERKPAEAIRADLAQSLAELRASNLVTGVEVDVTVEYFEPNETGLIAAISSFIPTDNGASVLAELVVTGGEVRKYVTLEQLSVVFA